MPDPCKFICFSDKNFSAPYISVCSISRSVKGKSDNRTLCHIFSHTTDNMGMMMLNSNFFYTVLLLSISGTHIIRMKIMRYNFRLNVKNPLHMFNGHLKKSVCCKVFHIADMLA